MNSNNDILAVYRLGITIGLMKPVELVQWIKKVINNEKSIPKTTLLEIASLPPEANYLVTTKLLDKVIGPHLPENAVKVVFGKIYNELQSKRITPVKATQLAYHAALEANLSGVEMELLNQLDDEGYLMQLGTSKREEKELEADIASFLSPYSSYVL